MCTTFRAGLVASLLLALTPAAASAGDPPLGCVDLRNDPEETQSYSPLQGSSDLNAQTGNTRLVAGLTREGTVTVLRWPTPSSYDQIKHFSPDANLRRAGADPNMGAFLGVVAGGRTVWLRDLPATQRYRPGDSDTIVTTYTGDGFAVTVESVVAHDADLLTHHVRVTGRDGARPTALVAFENLSLVVAAVPSVPFFDWCGDSANTDAARFDAATGAIVHTRAGFDPSRGARQTVAMGMATGSPPAGHQVGGDREELDAALAPQDAYADAADGTLSGSDAHDGNTTGALLVPLHYVGDVVEEDVHIAGAHDAAGVLRALREARAAGAQRLRDAKEAWLADTLAAARMPATTDRLQLALARRALILLATTQAQSGAIVASITTQPVYAEDWPRDSAYLAEVLDLAGLHEGARRHGLFLARTQATETSQPPGGLAVPPGAWPMNMYDTGASGGPIPYEYDEVGFGAWSMWHHWTHTRDRAYLEQVWPALRRSAELMVRCRDASGLQCRSTEDDSLELFQQRTIGAAMTTQAGLHGAEQAARILGHDADAARYAARRAEIVAAVDATLWEEGPGYYGGYPGEGVRKVGNYVFWPEFPPGLDPARVARHADWLWRAFAPSFAAPGGTRTFGFYDGLALLGLGRWAHAHRPALLPELRRGLRWIAHVQATAGTGHLGENWRVRDGRVQTITAVPQLWEHALFYLAALEVYGERCTPRRPVTLRAAGPIVSATLHDARGRRIRRLAPRGRTVRVRFAGLAARRVAVRMRVRGRDGRTRVVVRRLAVCARAA